MVKQVVFAVPGDLATPTGGYVYDRRIIAELPSSGWQVDVLDIGDGFPAPVGRRARHRASAACRAAGRAADRDRRAGLRRDAGGGAGAAPDATPLVALVHHPLALETGLPDCGGGEIPGERARSRLSFAQRVITTSATTARLLAQTTPCRRSS